MSEEAQVQKLLQAAIKAARDGHKDQARKAFLYVIKLDPRNETAWLGLATSGQDITEQITALKKLLEINPGHRKAREALRRLEPEAPAALPSPPAPAAPPPVEAEAPRPAATPIRSLKSLRPAAPETPSSPETALEMDTAAVPEAAATTTAPLFSNLPPLPRGENGIPLPDRRKIEFAAREADARIQAFLQKALEDNLNIQWKHKRHGRAGERDITVLRLQVLTAIVVFLVVTGGMVTAVLLNTPEFRELIFEPTWTVSPTFTVTPTNTPGVTPTSSETPELTLTPSPTLNPSVTPGNPDQNFRPRPTEVLLPQGLPQSRLITEALRAMDENRMEDAYNFLQEEIAGTAAAGNFVPYYYLVIWYLKQDNPASARETLTEGESRLRAGEGVERYGVLIETAYAQVLMVEMKQRLADGERVTALRRPFEDLTARIQAALDLDPQFVDAVLLMAERYVLEGNYEEAFNVLNNAQAARGVIFTDARIRLRKAELYLEQNLLEEALQELNELVKIHPFEREALRLRIEVALMQHKPGLASIFCEPYILYYPDDVDGYKLLGDAKAMEGKFDEALLHYARALQGDRTDPAYPGVLLSRAALYAQQQRWELAAADLTDALSLTDDPTIRVQRMNAAYFAGDYETALSDAEALTGNTIISAGEINLMKARIQIDRATPGDEAAYQAGLDTLNDINVNRLPEALRPVAREYVARAYYYLGNQNRALDAINDALAAGETGSRRYLRGLIYQARGDAQEREATKLNEYRNARRDFDFVLTWSVVYAYPFTADARNRYISISQLIDVLQAAPES